MLRFARLWPARSTRMKLQQIRWWSALNLGSTGQQKKGRTKDGTILAKGRRQPLSFLLHILLNVIPATSSKAPPLEWKVIGAPTTEYQ